MPASPVRYAFSSGRNPAAAIRWRCSPSSRFSWWPRRTCSCILLAAACVRVPALLKLMTSASSSNGQLILLFIFGIIIAGAMLWSLVPRPDRFKAPGLAGSNAKRSPGCLRSWKTLRARCNEPMPREVYLIGDVNAWVADSGRDDGIWQPASDGTGNAALVDPDDLAVPRRAGARICALLRGRYQPGSVGLQDANGHRSYFPANIGSLGQLARVAVLGVMYLVVATLMKWYFRCFFCAPSIWCRGRKSIERMELACLIAGRAAADRWTAVLRFT